MAVLTHRLGVLLVVVVCVVVAQAQKQEQDFEMLSQPMKEKRFYSWEDTKRAASSEEGLRAKRKQFYAWAGKRSSAPVHYFEDLMAQDPAVAPMMQKRKQFYAWAGK